MKTLEKKVAHTESNDRRVQQQYVVGMDVHESATYGVVMQNKPLNGNANAPNQWSSLESNATLI